MGVFINIFGAGDEGFETINGQETLYCIESYWAAIEKREGKKAV